MLTGLLLPHPPIIIPEVGGRKRKEAAETISAFEKITEEFVEDDTDLIISVSPHGEIDWNQITIDRAETLKGDLGKFNARNVRIKLKGASKLAAQVVNVFSQKNKYEVKGIDSGNLDHGLMVPAYYLENAGLAMDIPWLKLNIAFWEAEKLYEFGKIVMEQALENYNNPKVIISGDLSHKINHDSPAGYSPQGSKFDNKLVNDLKTGNLSSLLNYDDSFLEEAGECGYRPLMVGFGLLDGRWNEIKVKSYEAPYGVGYAVAGFYR
ncbi:MAG: hypothetical protein ABR596_03305 [Halarsenatibacteraceae bacterium]